MNSKDLRALQQPLKEDYKTNPEKAEITLHAEGALGEGISCKVDTFAGMAEAGLHPATGGDGSQACSGDMLLEALVACAGVTLKSVATAWDITLDKGTIRAEGVLDFKGTLGISREAPVGFESITLFFDLESDAKPKKLEKLIEVTERYCVVFQTLKNSLELHTEVSLH
ncbi:OsmC family protein [Fodinibius salsisoli]|uniref:OsmC family protein n=1 Tax=Fodinibius salsisoli TaxID=2820877 RepID=A0ABT3PLT3_9BACT|nr:OsmC family protein [Fodinibius salsisoli]MCW9706911.1 OsmC family protein [Fodinibius salsisoli]